MYDVVALGEILIDFTPSGTNELGMNLFACNPGGAPANLLAMHTKLGGKTAFIGKVGKDDFGKFLEKTMVDAGIHTGGLLRADHVPTTLAFVQLNSQGDRSFTFYRKPGADVCLTEDEVPESLLKDCHIFHFGSVSLTDEPCRTATISSARKAKAAGAIISYDPNYRPFLWDTEAHAKAELLAVLPLADIVKVSEEEMLLLTGQSDLEQGAKQLAQHGATLVLITLGSEGAFYYTANGCGHIAAYDVKTVDTTGAGDAFLGAVLFCIAGKTIAQLKAMSKAEWEQIVAFGNATGSLTTTAKGAIPAMPSRSQVEECIRSQPKRYSQFT